MSTHRVTLELPAASYRNLRKMVESGEYASESEAVAEVLLNIGLEPAPTIDDSAFERWMRSEVLPADDELEANPESGLSPEQLNASLDAARLARNSPR